MKTEDIRDGSGRLIGMVQTDPNGNKVVRDASYRIKGTYDVPSNVTRDASGKIVGLGDQALALLWR